MSPVLIFLSVYISFSPIFPLASKISAQEIIELSQENITNEESTQPSTELIQENSEEENNTEQIIVETEEIVSPLSTDK